MDMDERWVNRSPGAMLETFHWFRGEGFDLIVEDLLRLPAEPALIVEGFRLLPHLVQPLLAEPTHAVWLLPTPEFRRPRSERRGSSQWAFLDSDQRPRTGAGATCSNATAMFTDRLRDETVRLDLPAIEVDTTMTETELTARVTNDSDSEPAIASRSRTV